MTKKPDTQTQLPFDSPPAWQLPEAYQPTRPALLSVERVIFARGALDTPERQAYAERICALYPNAEQIDRTDTPHSRVQLGEGDPYKRHRKGKTTLVFGEHKSSVRKSEESGNTCPNYWHFSPTGFCFYDCQYCYLAGTATVWHSPTIRIYVNLEEIIAEIDRTARKLAEPTAFYIGKLQDGLALDPLTGYSSVLVPFFAQHPYARQVLLTKSADVNQLLDLEHGGNTILSWSLNPPEVSEAFERNVPTPRERLAAMKQASEAGYPVRAVLMPIIPVENWQEIYTSFIEELLSSVPLTRLTMGGICSYKGATRLMEKKLGKGNLISESFVSDAECADGRRRYPFELRVEMYRHLIDTARRIRPDLELALCLEEPLVWDALGLTASRGRCNCVL